LAIAAFGGNLVRKALGKDRERLGGYVHHQMGIP